jgi:hypothetical protein
MSWEQVCCTLGGEAQLGLPRGDPVLEELVSLPPGGHDAMRGTFLTVYPSNGFVMAIREFKISGVFGVVHELSTPSKLPLAAPAAAMALPPTFTFKLYIFKFVFG